MTICKDYDDGFGVGVRREDVKQDTNMTLIYQYLNIWGKKKTNKTKQI